jgi:uncharacterized protein (TIGR02996 family)
MSDEDALLAAIAAHPDEDTPRLVYADWLDEHDRPIRAEFIRLQIEIAQKETLPRAIQNRHVDLWKRNQELIDDHRDELLGPLAALPTDRKIVFRRGFVSELTIYVYEFHAYRLLLSSAHPRPRVTVTGAVAPVREFLGFDAVNELEEIDVVNVIQTLPGGSHQDPPRFGAGFQPSRWPRLEELDISNCLLADRNVALLLRRELFPVLTDLDLSGNDLTDSVIRSLLDANMSQQLKRLILGGNPLSDAGAIVLAEGWPTGANDNLEYLNLKFTNIGQPGHQALLARFGGRIDLF